jgi:shikimate dehydrogenase
MQNAALASAGIPASYSAEDVEPGRLQATLAALALEGAAGNITIPHKERANRLMGRLSPIASRVGATNTFFTAEEGELVGHNTDVAGFAELVQSTTGSTPSAARFAVIGAGGSAAAVLAAIEMWDGCSAIVYARNAARGASLASRFAAVTRTQWMTDGQWLDGDIVVNATPVGLNNDEFPAPLSSISIDAIVLDLVCRSGDTPWVRAARDSGRVASGGFPMLVGQGAAAFEAWFGVQPDREAMWRGLKLAMDIA